MTTVYRWRGAVLMVPCTPGAGYGGDFSVAVGEDCCCPPCVPTCCCTNRTDSSPVSSEEGSCLFEVRDPICCSVQNCTDIPDETDDPNISGDPPRFYTGGKTQIVGFFAISWRGSQFPTVNSPYNDYYIESVQTQSGPSTIIYSLCTDKARYVHNFHAGCQFFIPACFEAYIRDPYCVAENKDKCDPCADPPETEDCCGSTLDTVTDVQLLAFYDNYEIVDECPFCSLNVPPTCASYPPEDCRLNGGSPGDPPIHLLKFEDEQGNSACSGFAKKKCCYRWTFTGLGNQTFYQRRAFDVSLSLVGGLKCDGTDDTGNFGGGTTTLSLIGTPTALTNSEPQEPPTQEVIDCAYIEPYQ